MGQEKFQQADALFQQGKYTEARQLLAELNAEFPDTPNILYPLAMCLEKLGHADFALKICDQLIQKHQHPRAQELKTKIESTPPTAAAPAMAAGGMGDLGDLSGIGGTGGVGGMDDLSNLGSVDMNNLDVGGMDMGGMDMSNLGDLGGMDMGNLGDIGGVGGQSGSGMDMAGLGMDLGAPASRPAAARPVASQGRDLSMWYWFGGLAAVILLCTIVPYFIFSASYEEIEALTQQIEQGEGTLSDEEMASLGIELAFLAGKLFIPMLIFAIPQALAQGMIAAYIALMALSSLPEDDLSEDMKHIGITVLLCHLLMITIIGFLAIPFVIAKRYDLSAGNTVICIVIYIAVGAGIGFALMPVESILSSILF